MANIFRREFASTGVKGSSAVLLPTSKATGRLLSSTQSQPLCSSTPVIQPCAPEILKRAFGISSRKRPDVKIFPVTERKPKKPPLEQAGISLEHVFPGTPQQQPINTSKATTQTTTLDNGIIVATEETYDQASTIGVFINAGSANETLETNGTTHLLQRMGFKATPNRSNQQIVRQLETLGVNAVSSSSRECVIYSTDSMRSYTNQVVEILADTVQNPLFLEEDVEREKGVMNHELADLHLEPSTWLTEVVHELAFGAEGFGLSQICPPHNLEHIGRDQLVNFKETYYTGPNIVVAGVGVEHESFVQLISDKFKHISPVRSPKERRVQPVYKGGYHAERMLPEDEKKMKDILPQTGKEAPSHLVLAFGTEGLLTDDLYPSCVLQTLMGGGSSFSSGGPGKGMYSRLYREVLNQYGWVDSISCFNSFYKNAGLFGFYGTAPHANIGDLMQIMAQHSIDMAVGFSDEEVQRAKNQLSASIFMNLESRAVLYDDIGRQILSYGHRIPASELCEKIANVTEEDLVRVAAKIMSMKPSIAVYTPEKHIQKVPGYDVVVDWFPRVLDEAQKHRELIKREQQGQHAAEH